MLKKKTSKQAVLKLGKACKRCGNCCSYTSAYLQKDDINRISRKLRMTEQAFANKFVDNAEAFNTMVQKLKTRKGKYYGSCIMFDRDKGCLIHSVKPFYCRISTCAPIGKDIQEWFAVNYLVNVNDPESIRQWNFHVEFSGTIEGAKPIDLLPSKEKLDAILTYKILR
ncbi:MAG: YkgJ family cysteine cluster protein [Candidatus Woesearchaeota archaeon]